MQTGYGLVKFFVNLKRQNFNEKIFDGSLQKKIFLDELQAHKELFMKGLDTFEYYRRMFNPGGNRYKMDAISKVLRFFFCRMMCKIGEKKLNSEFFMILIMDEKN